MKNRHFITKNSSLTAIVIALVFCGCEYYGIQNLNKEEIKDLRFINSPSNVYLIDSTSIYFPKGFHIKNYLLYGNGYKSDLRNFSEHSSGYYCVHLDSILKIDYNLHDSFWYNFDSLH